MTSIPARDHIGKNYPVIPLTGNDLILFVYKPFYGRKKLRFYYAKRRQPGMVLEKLPELK
jgi:hypothetical protein